MIDDTYLVSEHITPVDSQHIDELEIAVGGTLPTGYRQYLERFGTNGQYMDSLRIWAPDIVCQTAEESRDRFDYKSQTEYATDCPLTEEDFGQLFYFAATEEGDRIIYFPRFQGELFILQRHADEIVRIKGGFADPLPLGFGGRTFECFRFFRPEGNHEVDETVNIESQLANKSVAELVAQYWTDGTVHLVPMPDEWGDDTFYVFVKRIGGVFMIIADPTYNDGRPYVGVICDRDHSKLIKEFSAEIQKLTAEKAR